MIDAGSTELNNLWKNVLHNQEEDYIIPESDVNVMCPYDCVSTSGNTVTGYSAESYCNVNALATGTTTINRNKKIATFEWNYWVLDGTFEVLDDNETVRGFVSTAISNENCEFSTSPFIFFDTSTAFPLRKNQTLKFNPPTNEIPASITIQSAGSGGVLNSIDFNIEEMLEEDNLTEREYVNLYSNAIDTSSTNTRAVIIFTKTLMPYRRARLTEYNNGYKFFKNKYDLQTFTHTRTVALAMDELPQNDLNISFVDLEGVFDTERTDSPFKISFNSSHRFYVYYGYNFDNIGWNYVQADYLSFASLEINRDSIETTFNMQSSLQLYNSRYNTNNLDNVLWLPQSQSWTHTQSAPYNWNTFKGFLTAIATRLDISDFTYSTNDIYALNTSLMMWQTNLIRSTRVSSEENLSKVSLKELIQQICAYLRCALVRQPNGALKLEYLGTTAPAEVDYIEASNVLSYPSKIEGEEYKSIVIRTPKIYADQSEDSDVTADAGRFYVDVFPSSKTFTISNAKGTDEVTLNQNIMPIISKDDLNGYGAVCWTWNAGIWQNYANHYSKVKGAIRYEFSEAILNPLIQVADVVKTSIGDNYSDYRGRVEKIEINYDGSFKGAITLCSFLND